MHCCRLYALPGWGISDTRPDKQTANAMRVAAPPSSPTMLQLPVCASSMRLTPAAPGPGLVVITARNGRHAAVARALTHLPAPAPDPPSCLCRSAWAELCARAAEVPPIESVLTQIWQVDARLPASLCRPLLAHTRLLLGSAAPSCVSPPKPSTHPAFPADPRTHSVLHLPVAIPTARPLHIVPCLNHQLPNPPHVM